MTFSRLYLVGALPLLGLGTWACSVQDSVSEKSQVSAIANHKWQGESMPYALFKSEHCRVAVFEANTYEARVVVAPVYDNVRNVKYSSRLEFLISAAAAARGVAAIYNQCEPHLPFSRNAWSDKVSLVRDEKGLTMECLNRNAKNYAKVKTDLTTKEPTGEVSLSWIDFKGFYVSHHGDVREKSLKCKDLERVDF